MLIDKSKILVVDDKPENLLAMEQTLKEVDVELITCLNGNDALKATLHNDFALIILDVQMPGMDGYELAELLRGQKETQPVPLMFLSAVYTAGYSLFRGYHSGAVDFLTKPIEPEIIINKVKTFVELDQQKQELIIARKNAEQADALKSRFLANVSHEIRTPMNAIIGHTDLMLLEELSQDHKEHLETVKTNGHLLLNLIDDLLDFSKIEADQLVVDKVPFALEEIIHNIDSTASILINKFNKDINFSSNVSADVSKFIITDKYRLHQILNNLLTNAIKFTDKGAIEISVGISPETELVFAVKDSGTGIPAEKFESIFKPFAQLENALASMKGAGLGLAITKKLVNLLGGDISIQSEVKKGATFIFTIPYEPTQPEITKADELKTKKQNQNVFLVDDDEANRILLSKILGKHGYSLRTATNGEEAISEYQKKNSIDIMIMDVQMPGMTGLEAVKIIRKMEGNDTRIPIIALTGYAMKSDRDNCLAAGYTDYISKPVDRKVLLETLQKY